MKTKNNNVHEFLLEQYFNDGSAQNVAVGNWVLVKWIEGNTKRTLVSVYSKESFGTRQKYLSGEPMNEYQEAQRHLQSIFKGE